MTTATTSPEQSAIGGGLRNSDKINICRACIERDPGIDSIKKCIGSAKSIRIKSGAPDVGATPSGAYAYSRVSAREARKPVQIQRKCVNIRRGCSSGGWEKESLSPILIGLDFIPDCSPCIASGDDRRSFHLH